MTRTLTMALLMFAAGASGAAAQQKSPRPLLPAGGMWQSIPHETAGAERPRQTAKAEPRQKPERAAPARITAKATVPARSKAQPAPRNPVPAAAVPSQPPAETAAARTRELARRIGMLSPGAKLDEAIDDPDNPAWRRRPADRPGADGRDFAVPIDDTGKAGFIARGYHQNPAWNNPNGNLGATVGLRQKF
jgi:hypothetical protein